MYQPELKTIPHSSFFSQCREKGITFDFEEKEGVLFALPGHLINGVMGVSVVHRCGFFFFFFFGGRGKRGRNR
jgi:hypothetical protein